MRLTLVDPKRTRFTSNNKQILEAAESRVVQFQRATFLTGEEVSEACQAA